MSLGITFCLLTLPNTKDWWLLPSLTTWRSMLTRVQWETTACQQGKARRLLCQNCSTSLQDLRLALSLQHLWCFQTKIIQINSSQAKRMNTSPIKPWAGSKIMRMISTTTVQRQSFLSKLLPSLSFLFFHGSSTTWSISSLKREIMKNVSVAFNSFLHRRKRLQRHNHMIRRLLLIKPIRLSRILTVELDLITTKSEKFWPLWRIFKEHLVMELQQMKTLLLKSDHFKRRPKKFDSKLLTTKEENIQLVSLPSSFCISFSSFGVHQVLHFWFGV